MPPPIVYEGVNGSYEGTLFGGLKFFVSKRLPLRSEAVAKIKDNGGKTVELEKFADLLIWDDLVTRGSPAGAVSVKFVEDCISKGQIVNKEEYLVAPSAVRPVGSSASTRKGTKNPFTPKDDQILLNWVKQNEEAGESVKGLAIYRELALEHPNHTYQSWRSRYIDKLSHLPQKSVRPLPPPTPTPVSTQDTPPSTSAEEASPSAPRGLPASTAPVTVQSSSSTQKRPARRMPFTAEDDKILLQYLNERGTAKSGNKVYKELEQEYPHHTWQSWRERYVKTLSKRWGSDPGGTTGAAPIRVPRPREDASVSELPPSKRPRTSVSSDSTVQSKAPSREVSSSRMEGPRSEVPPGRAVSSTSLAPGSQDDELRKQELRQRLERRRAERAISSSRPEKPGEGVRASNAVSSTPVPSGNQDSERRKQELRQKMERIRAERARKASTTPASTPQEGSFRRTSTISNDEQGPEPQLHPKNKGKEPQTPTPATEQTPDSWTQVSRPLTQSSQARAQPESTVSRQKQLEQARARSRENMTGLINSRESWLGLRHVFHRFNQHPEPSESLTVFGRQVDCWELWSSVVREGYPPSPAAWVRIAEGLGFTDDRDLLDEGQKSVVQALKEAFEEHLVEFWLATEWFAEVRFEPVQVEEE
ncbi:Rap1 Myb domain-containing protein [Triangularia verruculosa]|uniref:DNA-binding protein RAP1 n=1 Tax=Triangularia verruculosa TaxID=2587418 RepID=A0AAN6XD29_9PEZI|nr:Rap1 Myb domain-containing protein [Triangularia verruculosa]